MKEQLAALKVEEFTHIKVKVQAEKRGMTIKGYIEWLVNKDLQSMRKGK